MLAVLHAGAEIFCVNLQNSCLESKVFNRKGESHGSKILNVLSSEGEGQGPKIPRVVYSEGEGKGLKILRIFIARGRATTQRSQE